MSGQRNRGRLRYWSIFGSQVEESILSLRGTKWCSERGTRSPSDTWPTGPDGLIVRPEESILELEPGG